MKSFILKLEIDEKDKTSRCQVGFNEDDIALEDMPKIEKIIQQFCLVITTAYIKKAVCFDAVEINIEGGDA